MSETVPVRLPAIQALRAIAALMVVLAHVKIAVEIELLRIPIPDLPLSPFPLVAGVDVFFVVSGFVMALASHRLFGRQGAGREFLWRRLARIVPLYWLVTTALLALMVAIDSPVLAHTTLRQIAASYLFVPAPNPDGFLVPILDVGWTLNYEMLFYVVFALFVAARRTLALLAVSLTLLLIVGLGAALEPTVPTLRFWSDPIVLEFLFGIAIETMVRRGLALSSWTRLLFVGIAVACLTAYPVLDFEWRWLQWGVPAALLVAAAVLGPVSRGGWTRFAEWGGDISYALYLVHFFAIRAMAQIARRLGLGPTPLDILLFGFGAVALAVAMSWALHAGFERPVLRRLQKRPKSRGSDVAAVT